jgi:cell division septation protein DedD
MSVALGRRRARGGSGRVAAALFALTCLVLLGLTFLLGVLVGRQWARSTEGPARATGDAPEPGAVRRLGAGSETSPDERPGRAEPARDEALPAIQERLTFYRALPAPLAAGPPSEPRRAGSNGARATPGGAYHTVQVAAFKTREQAEALRADLGGEAYVAEVDGPSAVRYRVRVGLFEHRSAAEAVATRLRAERALDAFVTTR